MNTRASQILSLISGIMLVITILFAPVYKIQTNHSSKEVKTEQQKSGDDFCYITLPSFSIPTSIHVELNTDSFCLFEISFENQNEVVTEIVSLLKPDTFLLTLFRVIISPNAP